MALTRLVGRYEQIIYNFIFAKSWSEVSVNCLLNALLVKENFSTSTEYTKYFLSQASFTQSGTHSNECLV